MEIGLGRTFVNNACGAQRNRAKTGWAKRTTSQGLAYFLYQSRAQDAIFALFWQANQSRKAKTAG
jgi:hypothetical protein